ncbi:MAG: hypothetical protein P8Y95_17925 [Gammaproteobacteria bacterium]|jgi:hypothetical protein
MTRSEFEKALAKDSPPPMPAPLEALWWDAKNDWDAAHQALQADDSRDSAWVHAYLHRKEGDLANAGYWYRRANRPAAASELYVEWSEIVSALTGQ